MFTILKMIKLLHNTFTCNHSGKKTITIVEVDMFLDKKYLTCIISSLPLKREVLCNACTSVSVKAIRSLVISISLRVI